ncbi:unnamed protein product [Larinioides sclopetarius]|uniref:Uncharacterized protein n=1 Tax=Larinioides sclopetarius TaxID=280406 RepID=A0AAV2A5Y7_9ARAC
MFVEMCRQLAYERVVGSSRVGIVLLCVGDGLGSFPKKYSKTKHLEAPCFSRIYGFRIWMILMLTHSSLNKERKDREKK